MRRRVFHNASADRNKMLSVGNLRSEYALLFQLQRALKLFFLTVGKSCVIIVDSTLGLDTACIALIPNAS